MATNKSDEIAWPNFPAYAVCVVSGRHVVVGGGGGAAKTGILNQFELYELYHDGKKTKAERILTHDVGDYCISNMAGWANNSTAARNTGAYNISLAIGQEERCSILQMKPDRGIKSPRVEENIPRMSKDGKDLGNVRQRRGDSKEEKDMKPPTPHSRREKRLRLNSVNETLRGEKIWTYDVEEIANVETVFKKEGLEDIYQKCCRVFPDQKHLVTGGMDGYLRVWNLPNMKKIKEIKAHDKEIDDVDVKPDMKQIVSVSKPNRECCVFNVSDGKKFTQVCLQTNGVKYKCFRARYGKVENKQSQTRLFTISNPVSGSKNPAIVAKWCGRSYKEEKTVRLQGTLSSLALTDDGRYLATGTMGGDIYILISFSLQQFRLIENAHSMFVTGLEWLPTKDKHSQMVRGFSDASVVSISCDNTVNIHHVPRQEMLPVWIVALIAAFVLFVTFVLASYVGI
ncbi:unnamed protein product [Meganyctiphanes norvegica]|uniref:Prolactin regulatory element-binding protein n=1 Tax=Meganyctiphanes norvegica TaxID=48144 RepID=A0AAV2PU94_MEGNR